MHVSMRVSADGTVWRMFLLKRRCKAEPMLCSNRVSLRAKDNVQFDDTAHPKETLAPARSQLLIHVSFHKVETCEVVD